jgi:hypothetical protein
MERRHADEFQPRVTEDRTSVVQKRKIRSAAKIAGAELETVKSLTARDLMQRAAETVPAEAHNREKQAAAVGSLHGHLASNEK